MLKRAPILARFACGVRACRRDNPDAQMLGGGAADRTGPSLPMVAVGTPRIILPNGRSLEDSAAFALNVRDLVSLSAGELIRSHRHPLRAPDRHSVGGSPAGIGMQRHDLLAPVTRLAAGGCLGSFAPAFARRTGRCRQDRVGSCCAGCFNGSSKKGGPETGPNPTDRDRPGTKYHLLVDQNGIP